MNDEQLYNDGKQMSNLQRIHELEEMVSNLEDDNAKLRDLLRWRNVQDEIPNEGEVVVVAMRGMAWPNILPVTANFFTSSIATHWRPIGPLPKESE